MNLLNSLKKIIISDFMVAVIGDIHGCFYTLEGLYNKIIDRHPKAEIYCVGDLIDRGNNSFEVIEFLIQKKIKFTPGNHDYMFYHYFKRPTTVFARSWIYNGNETTLYSYEKHKGDIYKHIDFISDAPLFYNTEDCFISHAGVSSKYRTKLPENFNEDLNALEKFIIEDFSSDSGVLWTRDNLLAMSKVQVVGHTKQQDVRFDNKSNSYYVDTGACVGNKLSAVILKKSELIEVLDERTHLNDIV